ncbi:serine/threonine-protein kinase [Saccharothrix ecbatanensis]|uniref:Serine/threonine-protein kinase n=1 Tax=Saccharothrix ecbatanensis TaxID=1105145 RepID=A0A7W9M0Z0_9PSEU|nr:ricin-type beta-trefoil lectin domain protein [Saccharothrix ecbatanensis]MBB5803323.1 serine/threonine-protein kinase [Saccharothrix ecbatanensis]
MHIFSVKKFAVAIAVAASAFAASITFVPPAASAATIAVNEQITVLRSWATGRCLDNNFAGNVYTLPCQSGNNFQDWHLIPIPSLGRWLVRNPATGMCLATNRPGAIYTTACIHNWTMHWDIREREPRVYVFRAPVAGQCLDSDRVGNAYTHVCGSNFQDWKNGF